MAANTLHLGVVLAGAVSAGAYSAGVVDFLIEALDAWEKERLRDSSQTPDHRVVLDVLTGASAGGMTAAIAAIALKSDIHAMRQIDDNVDPGRKNRLYDAWVKRIDIRHLLGTRDLGTNSATAKITSILDATVLREIAMSALDVDGPAPPRSYIADPLHVLLTVSNLRGVPYGFPLFGAEDREYGMLCHADHVHFEMRSSGAAATDAFLLDPGDLPRNDWTALAAKPDDKMTPEEQRRKNWIRLVDTALATGAFPIGLQPRALDRPKDHYKGRFPETSPKFPQDLKDPYGFLCVDGGMIDNEPLDLARRVLEARAGTVALDEAGSHAVLLIDPFPNELQYAPTFAVDDRLSRVAPSILSALVNQVRFKPEELQAAAKPDVYTRFMIAPSREDVVGPPAQKNRPDIASGILGGFGGFLAEKYRRHDFQLGRRNCQWFLKKHFRLPRDNPLFASWRDGPAGASLSIEESDEAFAKANKGIENKDGNSEKKKKRYLPIIPVLGDAAAEILQPDPVSAKSAGIDELEILLEGRVRALGAAAIETDLKPILGGGMARWAVRKFFDLRMAPRIVEKARDKVTEELKRFGDEP
jgi:predicted acylesterase/phospholipase RssA